MKNTYMTTKNENFIFRTAEFSDRYTIIDFQKKLAKETENIELQDKEVKKGVTRLFEDEKSGKYYVVEKDKRIIGCIMITFEWSDWRNSMWVWLQSLYVLPEFRRQGAFKYIYHELKEIYKNCKEYCGIRLYVDKSNKTAIKTYLASGMDNMHYEMFEWEK